MKTIMKQSKKIKGSELRSNEMIEIKGKSFRFLSRFQMQAVAKGGEIIDIDINKDYILIALPKIKEIHGFLVNKYGKVTSKMSLFSIEY